MAKRVGPDDPELPIDKEFGRRVTAARKARGWSQWDLARALEPRTTQATVSALERGTGQSSWVIPVCRVLGLDPPVIGEPPEMERWIAVGRALYARSPSVLAYHLGMLEAVAAALSPATDKDVVPAKASRAH